MNFVHFIVNLFIYQLWSIWHISIDGEVTNKDIINIHVQAFVRISTLFLFGKYIEMRFLDSHWA